MATNKLHLFVFKSLCSQIEHSWHLLPLTEKTEECCCGSSRTKTLKKQNSFCFCSFRSSEPPPKKSTFPAGETPWKGIVKKFWNCMEKKREAKLFQQPSWAQPFSQPLSELSSTSFEPPAIVTNRKTTQPRPLKPQNCEI